jgi:hypothetical protein
LDVALLRTTFLRATATSAPLALALLNASLLDIGLRNALPAAAATCFLLRIVRLNGTLLTGLRACATAGLGALIPLLPTATLFRRGRGRRSGLLTRGLAFALDHVSAGP